MWPLSQFSCSVTTLPPPSSRPLQNGKRGGSRGGGGGGPRGKFGVWGKKKLKKATCVIYIAEICLVSANWKAFLSLILPLFLSFPLFRSFLLLFRSFLPSPSHSSPSSDHSSSSSAHSSPPPLIPPLLHSFLPSSPPLPSTPPLFHPPTSTSLSITSYPFSLTPSSLPLTFSILLSSFSPTPPSFSPTLFRLKPTLPSLLPPLGEFNQLLDIENFREQHWEVLHIVHNCEVYCTFPPLPRPPPHCSPRTTPPPPPPR